MQTPSRKLIRALGKMCNPYLLSFFSLSQKGKAESSAGSSFSLLALLPPKVIGRLSRVVKVACFPWLTGGSVAPVHPQKMYGMSVMSPFQRASHKTSAQHMTTSAVLLCCVQKGLSHHLDE